MQRGVTGGNGGIGYDIVKVSALPLANAETDALLDNAKVYIAESSK